MVCKKTHSKQIKAQLFTLSWNGAIVRILEEKTEETGKDKEGWARRNEKE